MPTATTRGQEVLNAIGRWPHWAEIGLVAKKEYGISQEQYQQILPEYQRFLALIIAGHCGLGMFSLEVDQVWHSHILATQRYASFCEAFYGQMIHHLPQLEPKADAQCQVCQSCRGCNAKCKNCQGNCKGEGTPSSAASFRQAYTSEFGALPAIWGLTESDGVAA